jgi:hypothetical protein
MKLRENPSGERHLRTCRWTDTTKIIIAFGLAIAPIIEAIAPQLLLSADISEFAAFSADGRPDKRKARWMYNFQSGLLKEATFSAHGYLRVPR